MEQLSSAISGSMNSPGDGAFSGLELKNVSRLLLEVPELNKTKRITPNTAIKADISSFSTIMFALLESRTGDERPTFICCPRDHVDILFIFIYMIMRC